MKLKGTEILLKMLEEEEVGIIFGYPGGTFWIFMIKLYHSSVN